MQNRLWDRRRELVEWLDDGAYLYVCGDAKQMAKDVRGTLVRAYADVKALGARGRPSRRSARSSAAGAICRTCIEAAVIDAKLDWPSVRRAANPESVVTDRCPGFRLRRWRGVPE